VGKEVGDQRKIENQGAKTAASTGEGTTQDDLKRLCTEFGNRARRNSEAGS
jgi:hypothetical protein